LVDWKADADADPNPSTGLGGSAKNAYNNDHGTEKQQFLPAHRKVSSSSKAISTESSSEKADSTIVTQSTNPTFRLSDSADIFHTLQAQAEIKEEGGELRPTNRGI